MGARLRVLLRLENVSGHAPSLPVARFCLGRDHGQPRDGQGAEGTLEGADVLGNRLERGIRPVHLTVRTVEGPGSHSVFVSRPGAAADLIKQASHRE